MPAILFVYCEKSFKNSLTTKKIHLLGIKIAFFKNCFSRMHLYNILFLMDDHYGYTQIIDDVTN